MSSLPLEYIEELDKFHQLAKDVSGYGPGFDAVKSTSDDLKQNFYEIKKSSKSFEIFRKMNEILFQFKKVKRDEDKACILSEKLEDLIVELEDHLEYN